MWPEWDTRPLCPLTDIVKSYNTLLITLLPWPPHPSSRVDSAPCPSSLERFRGRSLRLKDEHIFFRAKQPLTVNNSGWSECDTNRWFLTGYSEAGRLHSWSRCGCWEELTAGLQLVTNMSDMSLSNQYCPRWSLECWASVPLQYVSFKALWTALLLLVLQTRWLHLYVHPRPPVSHLVMWLRLSCSNIGATAVSHRRATFLMYTENIRTLNNLNHLNPT